MSPVEFNDFVTANFTKRFGSSFSARAENLARSLCAKAFTGYNNFKSVGFVLTKSQVGHITDITNYSIICRMRSMCTLDNTSLIGT